MSVKTYLLPVVGLVLGATIAYWGLGLLFVTPFDKIFPIGMLPLGLAVVASFALSWMNPRAWKILAVSAALPAWIVIALVLLELRAEGRSDDGKWLIIAIALLFACVVPSWLAHKWTVRQQI
jgi:hypothetical protein